MTEPSVCIHNIQTVMCKIKCVKQKCVLPKLRHSPSVTTLYKELLFHQVPNSTGRTCTMETHISKPFQKRLYSTAVCKDLLCG